MSLLLDLFLTFAKIGAFTFGGGYAMISLLDKECVEKKKWITADEMMDVMVIAESTPGPISINCATFAGYRQAGWLGAVAASLGMVMPSFVIILLISWYFERLLSYRLVANAFKGIRIAVALLIVRVAVKMIYKMVYNTSDRLIGILFVGAFFAVVFGMNLAGINLSVIYLIIISGILGYGIFGILKRGEMK